MALRITLRVAVTGCRGLERVGLVVAGRIGSSMAYAGTIEVGGRHGSGSYMKSSRGRGYYEKNLSFRGLSSTTRQTELATRVALPASAGNPHSGMPPLSPGERARPLHSPANLTCPGLSALGL